MIATVKMATGAGMFLLWYLMLMGMGWLLAGPVSALLYGLSLPLSGLLTLSYDEQIPQRLALWEKAPWRGRHLKRLADERAGIVGDLDLLAERYLAAET